MSQPTLHIDFETRSELDLKQVGLYNYVRHPSTDVWCMSWALEEMEPLVFPVAINDHKTRLADWAEHVRKGGRVVAHNAPFELAVWNSICVPRYGWPVLKPEQTFCTMAMCYAMGLPGALEDAALALGLHMLKDAEGRALMLRMCRPRSLNPTVWWDEPEKLTRLYEYCKQDVRVERELEKRLMPLSDRERRIWLLDYKINQRGVAIDLPSVDGAIKLAAAMKEKYNDEIAEVTNNAATTCTALGPIKEFLAANGVPEAQTGLAKQDVTDILARDDLTPVARRVLVLRQEAGKASTAKFDVMARHAGPDGRLHNLYQYHGAATGRWAGRGVQVHNLVRDMPKAKVVEQILELVRTGEHDVIDAVFGPPLSMVSRCMRSLFVAPSGKVLVSGDFANVEGRGQAWFAGEEWKIQAFIAADNKTGPGIYELAYSRMFSVPVESVKDPSEERQVGKVAELAFGYQGGVGSFHTMGKNYGVKVSDAKADEFKDAWRNAHPAIAGVLTAGIRKDGGKFYYRKGGVWTAIQRAAIDAVLNPGETYTCGAPGRQAKFKMVGSFCWCLLPSGRAICYPYPKILAGEYGNQFTYMSVPGQDKSQIIYDPKNVSNWARVGAYGGSFFNNIVQGFSRDLLLDSCLLPLDDAGATIVLHTHDDGNIEVETDKGEGARAAMEQMMRTPPAWAKGFPLYAKCKLMQRYGK